MGALHIKTTGHAENSGSTDTDSPTHSGSAATVSGSVVTLDGSPDLSGLITSGANQSSIFLADATNSNMKIFWITAFDNTAKTVTVHAAPSGITSSAWRIGGRHVLTPASITGAARAGDEVIFHDSPAASASGLWIFRNSGSTTSGFVTVRGDGTAYHQLTLNGTGNVVATGSSALAFLSGLELIQTGASGNACNWTANNCVLYDVIISDAGGDAVVVGNGGRVIRCEFSGVGGSGFSAVSTTNYTFWGNYVYSCGGNGFDLQSAQMQGIIAFNVIANNDGRGIYFNTGGPTTSTVQLGLVAQNTVYGNNNSGFEATDVDFRPTLIGNIFKDNGNASGEYNVQYPSDSISIFSAFNIYDASGGRGGSNFNNFAPSALDLTSDPLFVDAGAGDFRLQSGSPALAASFPGAFVSGPQGYLDIGALQRIGGGGGGGGAVGGSLVGGSLVR